MIKNVPPCLEKTRLYRVPHLKEARKMCSGKCWKTLPFKAKLIEIQRVANSIIAQA